MKAKRNLISAAAVLAIAAASPAYAVLERMGPIDKSPSVGGYPSWFQDSTGVAVEFCDPKNAAELDGGWCVVLTGDLIVPEVFPTNFFDEHFYYSADNGLSDPALGFRARLVVRVEAAFGAGPPADGDQMTFQRVRVFMPNVPFDGDYRVITPYSDVTYANMKAGDRVFETLDVGIACIATFECTLSGPIGPFLLPSPVAGGGEVPPMPDLLANPGADPFFVASLAGGAPTPDPGTGKKYLADPLRIGPITGSSLPNFTDSTGASRNHNTFRVEYTPLAGDLAHQPLAWDGENNFSVLGRLMTGTVPGQVTEKRAVYKADSNGVTDLDVFARGNKTLPSRVPAAPIQPLVQPVINVYDKACVGTPNLDGAGQPILDANGQPTVRAPFSSPGGLSHPMSASGTDYWAKSVPGGTVPPSQVCIEDITSRNAAGQVVPAYYPVTVTDDVSIASAQYDAANNGTLTVKAASSDTTAVLTLAAYGNGSGSGAGTSAGRGAGAGLDLASGTATVTGLNAPPSTVQVSSNFGGNALLKVSTTHASTPSGPGAPGAAFAVNDVYSSVLFEDCAAHATNQSVTDVCAKGPTLDLLANDTILVNGNQVPLRTYMATLPRPIVTVAVVAPPRLGTAVLTNGRLTYTPAPNANGTDTIGYTVTVNGQTSNQAVATFTIKPMNDVPVAGNTVSQAVVNHPIAMNLIATATDPDGNFEVTNAVVVPASWPASFGSASMSNGVVTFTPTVAGNFTFTYQVKDVKTALSTNQGTASVSVLAGETIAYTKQRFTGAGNVGGASSTRWVVTGTDTVLGNQILTIAYADGRLANTSGQPNNGSCVRNQPTDPVPSFCIIGTAQVDALGAWTFDQVGSPGGLLDPNDTATWAIRPTNLFTRSTSPSLGGSATIAIEFK